MLSSRSQLFFLSWTGHLCAANSSLFIDTRPSPRPTDRSPSPSHQLCLSSPSPITSHLPTPESHPPPRLVYDPLTATISVHFEYDPSFSVGGGIEAERWREMDWLLEVVPKRKSDSTASATAANPFDKLAEWLPFGRPSQPTASTSTSTSHPRPSQDAYATTEEDDSLDDSPDPMRHVRVAPVSPGWRDKVPLPGTEGAKKWLKRQWDVANILVGPGLGAAGGGLGRGGLHSESAESTLRRHPVPATSNAATTTNLPHPSAALVPPAEARGRNLPQSDAEYFELEEDGEDEGDDDGPIEIRESESGSSRLATAGDEDARSLPASAVDRLADTTRP